MSAHILVVDDEPKIADVLRKYLQAEGYTASVLHSGEKAVDTIRALRPDAVLLDVMLPGMDGFSLAGNLRSEGRFVPILMLTARGSAEETDEHLQANFDSGRIPVPAYWRMHNRIAWIVETLSGIIGDR